MKLNGRTDDAEGMFVAPARERGLKYKERMYCCSHCHGRSRKGAWIEILLNAIFRLCQRGRSRKGAWIEICYLTINS